MRRNKTSIKLSKKKKKKKMQAAASSVVGFSAVLPAAVKGRSLQIQPPRRRVAGTRALTVRVRAVAVEAAEVDYSSNISVFPMEACDLIGGETCNVQMYPEAKLSSSAAVAASRAAAEEVDREYLSYDEPRTVFPEEACDDLGGEFCEAPYQAGVSST
uniref:Light-regulated protein n=1 Tax=Leersia perrieri TaxID=77586 RepID=A0A0D9UVR9_9ORYZ